MKKIAILCVLVLTVSGCGSNKKTTGRYALKQDEAPRKRERIPDLSKIPNAKPRREPKSKIGNPKTYTVFKKKYKVMDSSKGYKKRGRASWYGKKFHGYKTSNGEVYDMYGMTAAHKTLPLPTYLKVTNMKNKKQVIVRVNDRGPFHGDRILDLSYAAASKLGLLAGGTGDVEIHAIDSPVSLYKTFLQIGAFSKETNARDLARKLEKAYKKHKIVIHRKKLFHVHIGPIKDDATKNRLIAELKKSKFPTPVEIQLDLP